MKSRALIAFAITTLLFSAVPGKLYAYEGDVHYAWTYYLALHVGFTKRQAYQIASGAFAIDWDPQTGPMEAGAGDAIFGANHPGLTSTRNPRLADIWRDFHAFHQEWKSPPMPPSPLGTTPESAFAREYLEFVVNLFTTHVDNNFRIGRAEELFQQALRDGNPGPHVHYIQDFWSHAAFNNFRGHAVAGHAPDFLGSDPMAARNATLYTIASLQRFMKEYVGKEPKSVDMNQMQQVLDQLIAANPLPDPIRDYIQLFQPIAKVGVPWPTLLSMISDRPDIDLTPLGSPDLNPARKIIDAAIREDEAVARLPHIPAACNSTLPVKWYQFDFDGAGSVKDKSYPVERLKLELGSETRDITRLDANNVRINLKLPYKLSGYRAIKDRSGTDFLSPLVVKESVKLSDFGQPYERHPALTPTRSAADGSLEEDYLIELPIERPASVFKQGPLSYTVTIDVCGLETLSKSGMIALDGAGPGAAGDLEAQVRAALTSAGFTDQRGASVGVFGQQYFDAHVPSSGVFLGERLKSAQPSIYKTPADAAKAFDVVAAKLDKSAVIGSGDKRILPRFLYPTAIPTANILAKSHVLCGRVLTEVSALVYSNEPLPNSNIDAFVKQAYPALKPVAHQENEAITQAVIAAYHAKGICQVGADQLAGPPSPATPSSGAQSASGQVRLTSLIGSVQVQTAEGGWLIAAIDTALPFGRKLNTGPRSQATVTFPDGATFTVFADTTLSIDNKGVIILEQGAISDVTGPPGIKHEVITPLATASPSGTRFTVRHDTSLQVTTISVAEGEIRVIPTPPGLQPLTLRAGQQVQIFANRVGPITAASAGADTTATTGSELPVPPYGTPEPNASVPGMTLQASQRRVMANELVVVPFWLVKGENVANINFEVTYNANIARPEGAIGKGNLLDNALLSTNANQGGVIRAGFAQTSGLSGTGTVLNVPFRAAGKAGERTRLELKVTTVNDPNGGVLKIDRIPGEIVILDARGGMPQDPGTAAPGTGVAPGGAGVPGAAGPGGLVAGDCDGDGRVTTLDARCALEMSVQLVAMRLTLDMDASNDVTSRDAVLLLERAVGR